jgi:tripartite-type tricarboxylate transporter receptor subunit TctC
MQLKKLALGCALLGALVLGILGRDAAAAYPDKVITIVVPTAPGGANDAMARVISQRLTPILGQTVIVDNKPGGNGAIASEYVARSAPDGYKILFGYIGTHAMNPALQKLRYDPVTDFEPIGMIATSPTLMVANPSLKANDPRELVVLLKANPGKFSYASAGNGTAPQFAAEMFKLSTGTSMLHVPYKGSAPAITDTMGGQTDVMFPSLFTAYPFVKAGKLKAFAVAGPKRSAMLPDVPTLKELGIQNVEVSQWYALFAPAKTPRPVIEQLNKALNAVLMNKEVVQRIEAQGAEVETSTPEQLKSYVQEEVGRWKKVVQATKITTD